MRRLVATLSRALAPTVAAALLFTSCGGAPAAAPSSSASAGASASASGASSDWAKTVEAANNEGSVVLYSSLAPAVLQSLQTAFAKVYPKIQLQYVRQTDTVTIAKIPLEESGGGGADAMTVATFEFIDSQNAAGKLVGFTSPNLDGYPKEGFRFKNAVIVHQDAEGIAYNTNVFKTPPTQWTDLLQPQYKGRIGTLSFKIPVVIAWYDWLRSIYGPDIWNRLAAVQPKFYDTTAALAQAVASGELDASFNDVGAAVNPLTATGAPVKFVVPSTKEAFTLQDVAAVLTQAHHPNAAKVLVDFMASKDGQAAMTAGGLGFTMLPGMPTTLQIPAVGYQPAKVTQDNIDKLTKEFNGVFGL